MSFDRSDERPWVVLVGGFLGAGKTSLILTASRLLAQQGIRTAAIFNDQGKDLVDTHYAEMHGIASSEVVGGCFCCRFSELTSAIEKMRDHKPAVIFAEPVGSCTDISVTVLGPLREEFDQYRLAPFTVLVDPGRAALLNSDADPNQSFLFQKQLQEADLVCLNKMDLYPKAVKFPGTETRYLSAKTGRGVQEWLNEILSNSMTVGAKTLEIDYEQYARAEAALAWLNLSLTFEPTAPVSPASVIGPFLDHLDGAFTAAGISIVHLKLFDRSSTGWLKAAICANGEEPVVEGALDASPVKSHELLLNLRAVGDPARVQEIVEQQAQNLDGSIRNVQLECFSPAAPKPERATWRIPAYRNRFFLPDKTRRKAKVSGEAPSS